MFVLTAQSPPTQVKPSGQGWETPQTTGAAAARPASVFAFSPASMVLSQANTLSATTRATA